jgi:hypothetical protein
MRVVRTAILTGVALLAPTAAQAFALRDLGAKIAARRQYLIHPIR